MNAPSSSRGPRSATCIVCGDPIVFGRGPKRICSTECRRVHKNDRQRSRHACPCGAPRPPNCAKCVACVEKRKHETQQRRYREKFGEPFAPKACARCGVLTTKPIRTPGSFKYCPPCRTAVERLAKASGGNHRRRARHFGVSYEPIDSVKLFKRDGWVCQICNGRTNAAMRGRKHPDAPELDHRVPLSKGGSHVWGNVQTAHRRCNLKKNATNSRGQLPIFERPIS